MSKTTRREFIKKSGMMALSVGLSQQAFWRHVRAASESVLTQAAALSPADRILVVIQLDGGNDGLNTVIPLSGSAASLYRQYRPTLAIPETNALPIGTDAAGTLLGFHRNMQPLKELYDRGYVAVIQSVGYPNPNRSHFASQDIWHTGDPEGRKRTGWLGRYLDVTSPSAENPLLAVSLAGTRLPLTLHAEHVLVPAVGSVANYQFRTQPPGDHQNKIRAFLALNRETASDHVLRKQIQLVALDTYESVERLQSGIQRYTSDPAITYNPQNSLAQALRQVAQILAATLGTRILYVSIGGFDTHQSQANTHATLLARLSEAVATFHADLVRLGLDDRVLIMTWSEFGRKVTENGNQGTDHGTVGPQFLIGTRVKGRIVGEHPSLRPEDLNPGLSDPKFSARAIDFRSIYATILEKWFLVDSREILGGGFELLDIL
ncbi:MAG: DUF1501 domain-containing protein [Blastocatellia bacterium]|nr:DUF1501 domain-containing protein [Blastocatellia bacterium]MCS7156660.1 DUF1501 domain-containing protein [Blastocatellia bacterium]MCX7751598.1 DUF1501 domain-containing protein [Blastocatellia bacterium]MDW8168698.1 DUF1501 domain-containing protein [Acidobacteriota bacterium]MDW8256964.1 DUF1501 domain-containing protein [Acidobacteriota bacterium]